MTRVKTMLDPKWAYLKQLDTNKKQSRPLVAQEQWLLRFIILKSSTKFSRMTRQLRNDLLMKFQTFL